MTKIDAKGATAIEYALLIALIAVSASGAFSLLGQRNQQTMAKVEANLAGSAGSSLAIPPPPP